MKSPSKQMKDAVIAGFEAELDFWKIRIQKDDNLREEFDVRVPFYGQIAFIDKNHYNKTFYAYIRSNVEPDELCHFIEDSLIEDFGEELTLEEACDSVINYVKDKIAFL